MAHKNDNNDSSFGKEKESFCCVDVCACECINSGWKINGCYANRYKRYDGDDDGQYNCNKEILPIKSGSDLIRFEF